MKKTEFRRNNVKMVYSGTETLTVLGPRVSFMEFRKISQQVFQKVGLL